MNSAGRLFLAILLLAVPHLVQAASAQTLAEDSALLTRLIQRVNHFRELQDLMPLVVEPRLMAAAQAHVVTMADQGCFAHVCADGVNLVGRLDRAGYPYRFAAENISGGYTSPERVVEIWMGSETHRRNILNPAAREVGTGTIAVDRQSDPLKLGRYWVMVFGAQRGE